MAKTTQSDHAVSRRILANQLFVFSVAFVLVLATQKNQRLGDMVANTLVVRK